jgi:hypothetical protein
MSHFAIHSVGVAAIYEMPAIAESTWQGACLTCAEMARRGLISDEHLPVLLGWLAKAWREFHLSVFSFTIDPRLGHLFRYTKRVSLCRIKCEGRCILRSLVTCEGAEP